MTTAGLGEAAAFATAVAWGFSNQIQSAIGWIIGANSIILLRLPYQFVFLGGMVLLLGADTAMPPRAFALLLLSGFAGISLCDFMLYRAIYILGPPISVLLQSLSAGFAVFFGWMFLDEALSMQALLGILITLGGIGWVITERSGSVLLPGMALACGKTLVKGVVLGVGAAMTLAISFLFLRMAMQTGVDPLWGTFVRMICGASALWIMGLFKGWAAELVRGVRANPRVLWMLLISSACGGGGMWLSSEAMAIAPVGVVTTIIGLQPVMVTIIGALWYRKPPTLRILLGIAVSFCGTALVCLR